MTGLFIFCCALFLIQVCLAVEIYDLKRTAKAQQAVLDRRTP